jgi:PAS domain S-box-containing protein
MHYKKAYRRIQLGFAAAAICIGFFVVITYLNMHQAETESSNVRSALQNLLHLENTLTDIQSVETGQRGYMLTGEEKYLLSHNNGLLNIQKNIAFFKSQISNDPLQKKERAQVLQLIEEKIKNSKRAVELRRNAGFDSATAFLKNGQGEELMNGIRAGVQQLEDMDRLLLRQANVETEKAAKRTTWQFVCLASFFYIILYLNYRALVHDLKRQQTADEKSKYNAALLNNISDPIITTDKDLKIIKWNKYAEELYGWKEDEVKGRSMKEVLDTKYGDTDYDLSVKKFREEGVWRGEVMHTHKDGRILHVLSTNAAMRDESGHFSGAIAVIRDITARKMIEKRLKALTGNLEKEVKEKVAELNDVFERITDAFIALDNNWNYTYLNAKAAEMHGKTSTELVGKNIWDFFPEVVNEDFYTALHKARETMQPLRLELYYSRTGQWFEDLIYPSPDGISVYYHDITDKKKIQLELLDAESKFRNLVEESTVGVYIIQNEKFVYANPCFSDIFGYTTEQIMREVKMLDLIAETDRQRVFDNIQANMHVGNKSLNYEFSGLNSKGEIIDAEVFGTRMLYKGEPAIIGTVINITERKKALKRLEDSEEALRKSNERFMLVARATNEMVWDWDLNTNQIWGNESFSKLYDLQPGVSVSFDDFTARIHPDDVTAMKANLDQAMKNRTVSVIAEFRFAMQDGNYRTFHDKSYILYDNNSKAFRMLGAIQDITVQKLSQQQLLLEKELSDSIINSLPGIFYLYNKDGKFYRWNKNFEDVTGYSPQEIEKLHPLDLFPAEEKALLMEKITKVFAQGEDNIEAHFLTKDKDQIPYYFTGMVINYEGEECLMGVGLDLSERVKSQQKLIESEEKFRTLIEQASDGIFLSNQIGDCLVVNSSAATLTGYSKEELLQMNIRDLLYETDMHASSFKIREMLRGQVVINERLMKQKNGNLINVEISAKLLRDGRFQGIVRDITTRKWAEEGLRYSEEKRRLIMNAALDAIICIDKEGLVTFWNAQAENVFGWKAEEVYGTPLSNSIIPERFRQMHDRGLAGYLKTGKGRIVNKIVELAAINRQGDEFPVELIVSPISQGNEIFFCAFIRDITSRKKAEEEIRMSEHKYRLLFDQNPMPMWMISLPEKNFLAVNAAAVDYYGYSKAEFLGMNIRDLRPAPDTTNLHDVISTYKSGINNTGIWQHKKKDGTVVKVNLITHDIIYQGKHAKLVLANDVTEKIRAEEKLKSSHAELRELATHLQNVRESERTHMAREIHDELGQQLTGLKMDISWINRKLNTEDKELKQKMNDTLNLIDGTVKTVRRLATQLRPSILDDLGIVAAMEWQSEEFQKRSEINTVFSSNVSSIELSTDLATGFFRIYQESLTNVLRHSGATEVEAMLNMKDGLLILNIKDNGIGFNSKEIESKKTLGLLGMKERTLIMGGSYEITSKPGKGTSVVIIAPIQQNLTKA